MKLYEISQLPVMDGDRIVGILDESDVLLHVYGDEARFRDPVSTAMVSKLEVMDVKSPIEALLPVFDRGQVAIVTDGDHFLGLITRIDLLNFRSEEHTSELQSLMRISYAVFSLKKKK